MLPEQQITVLMWQVAAALLMGLDYFCPKTIRAKADAIARSYFERVDRDLSTHIDKEAIKLKKRLPSAGLALFFILTGALFFFVGLKADDYISSPKVLIAIAVLTFAPAVALLITGITFISNWLVNFFETLGVSTPFRIFVYYVLNSPKGPLAAMGFLCLCISFYLRYNYISI